MKAVVAAFNQEKDIVGAFSVIVQPVVEPMDRFTALVDIRFQIKLFNLNSVAAGRPGCRPGDVKLLQFNV